MDKADHKGRKVGYARVSTREQNLDVQTEALKAYGVEARHLHVEKISASAKVRPAFKWALKTLRPGDEFVVHALDRVGRDMREVLKSIDTIREAGARFKSLTQGYIDDETTFGRFMMFIQAAIAQHERDNVIDRTNRGVATARRKGVRFGVLPKLDAKQRAKCRVWKDQGMTVREIQARVKAEFKIKVSHTAIQNYVRPKPPQKRKT